MPEVADTAGSTTGPAGRVRWRFDDFEFDERTFELRRDGRPVALPRKPLELLHSLLTNPGQVVTKEELLDALWPGRIVSESSLFQAVAQLRQALGDAGAGAIRTVHGHGYRWMAETRADVQPRSPAPGQAVAALAPGQAPPLRPHWRLRERLGGGIADVWLVEHAKTGDRRIYKFGQDALALTALKREITLYRVLRETLGERDDFVSLLDWNFEEVPYFLETEYAAGGNLIDWASRAGGLAAVPLEQRLELVARVADALGAAHAAGVLHKDLKPANILIARDSAGTPRPKIGDFGSGHLVEAERLRALEITRMGFTQTMSEQTSGGTWLYLAPEVAAGQPPTSRSDLYSLGVMLYQIVAGDFRRPLTAGWEADVEDELLREDIAALANVDPAARLLDAGELAIHLRELDARRSRRAQQRAAEAAASEARAALARSRVRRRWLAVVAGVLLLGFGASSVLYLDARRARELADTERNRARQEAEVARAVTSYLTNDILAAANPAAAPEAGMTVADALDMASASAAERFATRPRVEGAIRLSLGESYLGLGRLDAAERELRRARALLDASAGPADEDTVRASLQLADVRTFAGDYEEARELLTAVAATTDPQTAPRDWLHAEGRLAGLDKMLGDAAAAIERLESVLPIAQSELPAGHETLQELHEILASAYVTAGDDARGATLFEAAWHAARERHGEDHVAALRPRVNHAAALRRSGRPQLALEHLEASIDRYRSELGAEHIQTLWASLHLARTYRDLGRRQDAIELAEHCLAARTRMLGAGHRDTLSARRLLDELREPQASHPEGK